MSKKKTPTSTDVGTNVLDELTSLVEKVTALVGNPPALTAADMKRATKLRKGGETVIPTVAALSNQFGLTISSHPADTMVAKLKKAQSLIPLHKKLVTATKQVGDSIFQAQSESWASAAVHYATLSRIAKSDGDVAKTLAPVKQFFAHRAPAVVEAEDAKRGGKKGSKAAKAAKEAKAAATGAPSNGTPAASTAPATPPVTIAPAIVTAAPTAPASQSAVPSLAPVTAPHS
jgi:hypothetical protein